MIKNKLGEKFKNIPPEDISTPPLNIAGPLFESLRFNADEPDIRELYINLLAASMHGTLTPSNSVWSSFKLRDDRLNQIKEVMDPIERNEEIIKRWGLYHDLTAPSQIVGVR